MQSSVVTPPPEEKSISLTEENIQVFYDNIVKIAAEKKPLVGVAAERVRNNYILYLKHFFGIAPHAEIIRMKTKGMLKDISLLISHKLIDNVPLAMSIMNDMSNAENVIKAIPEDEREEFTERLERQGNEAIEKAAKETPVNNALSAATVQLKGGITLADAPMPILEEGSLGSVLVAAEQRMKAAVDRMIQAEFVAGREQMQLVIQELQTQLGEMNDDQKRAVTNFRRMYARSSQAYGVYFQNLLDFPQAILHIGQAIKLVKELHDEGLADTTADRQLYQKTLAQAYSLYGDACRKQKDFQGAIKNLKAAINILKTIDPEVSEDNKVNLFILRRKLAISSFMSGIKEMKILLDSEAKQENTINLPLTCEAAVKDVLYSIRILISLSKKPFPANLQLTEEQSKLVKDEIERELDASRIAVADIYQQLTIHWCKHHNLIEAMRSCKEVVDALMPGYTAGTLAKGHLNLLQDSDVTLMNLVAEYRKKHEIPHLTPMTTGYKAAADILIVDKMAKAQRAWMTMAEGVNSRLTNTDLLLFRRALINAGPMEAAVDTALSSRRKPQ